MYDWKYGEKVGKKCSWLLEAQLSPNQTITYGYGTLHRYYILSCILVPTGAFEWSLVTKENKGALTKKFHPASCLADFGRWRGLSESVEKTFFSDNVEWIFVENDICWLADVKANIKQQERKDLVAVSYKFFLDVYFSFWFWLVFPCPA